MVDVTPITLKRISRLLLRVGEEEGLEENGEGKAVGNFIVGGENWCSLGIFVGIMVDGVKLGFKEGEDEGTVEGGIVGVSDDGLVVGVSDDGDMDGT